MIRCGKSLFVDGKVVHSMRTLRKKAEQTKGKFAAPLKIMAGKWSVALRAKKLLGVQFKSVRCVASKVVGDNLD